MLMVDVDDGQTPLLTLHCKICVPVANPVTALLKLFGLVIVAVPESKVQIPVPETGLFAITVVTLAQTVWLTPAVAVVGGGSLCIKTVELETGQTPLVIFHCRMFCPTATLCMEVPGWLEKLMIAAPPVTLHCPVPTAGVLPLNVAVVEQIV